MVIRAMKGRGYKADSRLIRVVSEDMKLLSDCLQHPFFLSSLHFFLKKCFWVSKVRRKEKGSLVRFHSSNKRRGLYLWGTAEG